MNLVVIIAIFVATNVDAYSSDSTSHTNSQVCASISSNCDASSSVTVNGASRTAHRCNQCGFTTNGVVGTGVDDCYTCTTGKQIAVVYADCTGYCIDTTDVVHFTAGGYPPMAAST